MEQFINVIPNVHDCPSLYIAKVFVCLLVAAFVVYLPLGEPSHLSPIKETITNSISIHKVKSDAALGYICDFYNHGFIKYAKQGSDALNCLICFTVDILYNAKLKFYALLEKLDGEDLCSTVCCMHIPNDDGDTIKNRRSCTKKNKKSNCRKA